MSRAFVKEPDGDEFADELPERPQHPIPNYVTPAGFAALEAQREALIERRDELVGDDQNLLDKEHLKHVERDLRYVDGRLEHAVLVDPAAQDPEEVAFGAIVEVADEDDARHSYEIVGEDESDVVNGKVSWISPLARALIGARVGEPVTWQRPAGDLELEITAIRYRTG
jgi:transcription elongation GreA/GreB family factor